MKILSCGAKYFKNLLDSNLQTMVLLFGWTDLCAICKRPHAVRSTAVSACTHFNSTLAGAVHTSAGALCSVK